MYLKESSLSAAISFVYGDRWKRRYWMLIIKCQESYSWSPLVIHKKQRGYLYPSLSSLSKILVSDSSLNPTFQKLHQTLLCSFYRNNILPVHHYICRNGFLPESGALGSQAVVPLQRGTSSAISKGIFHQSRLSPCHPAHFTSHSLPCNSTIMSSEYFSQCRH